MEKIKDIRNDLFKRNEISFKLEADKNPNFVEAKKLISEQVGKPEENINIYNIKGNFGNKNFIIDAYVYDSKEDLEKAIQKTQKQRKAEADVASKEEEAEKAEVKSPVEEVEKSVEEAPVEEKPEEEAKAVVEEKQGKEEAKEN